MNDAVAEITGSFIVASTLSAKHIGAKGGGEQSKRCSFTTTISLASGKSVGALRAASPRRAVGVLERRQRLEIRAGKGRRPPWERSRSEEQIG